MAAVRLADLLAGLSRFADLGFGLEAGTALRSCFLATRLASTIGLSADESRAAFYTALLQHLGCVGFAHETAALFRDEIAVNVAAGRTDTTSPRDLFVTFLPTLTSGAAPGERARVALTALARVGRWGDEYTAVACEVGREAARRMGLPGPVQEGLLHAYDTWRRTGGGGALSGNAIPLSARIARLAGVAAVFDGIGGPGLAVSVVRGRARGMLDPVLVSDFAAKADGWFDELADVDAREAVLEVEPEPWVSVPDLRAVAEVFADLADLKSPWLTGHSRAVAALATSAAPRVGLDGQEVDDLAVAALLHDVGRVAVSSRLWDKPGPLSMDDWEQVRLHPYHSERILAGSAVLAPLASLVGRHHERLDGSGYHRGCRADDLSTQARLLACADVYAGMTSARPHRSGLSPARAEEEMLDAVRRGALDADTTYAVLEAAGRRPPSPPRTSPRGLSDREVEVLGLLAHGCSNAEIATRLVVSRRTAEHHVQHIYTKIGASSRAAATLFAVENDLLGDG